nr:MAG: hypothetical protein [Bacteriophage sp.]
MKLLNREHFSIEKMSLIGRISLMPLQSEAQIRMVLLKMVGQMEDIATRIQRR